MSRVLGRALAVLPAELGGNAPGPLHALLSALASASSRQEEECLVRKELSVIQQQLKAANFNPDVASECLVRLIHCSTLGYPIGFCTIHALTLAQRGTSWHKRLGYLACCLLLHENHELLLLLVNTLMKDLQNGGPLEIGMALTVAGQLTPPHAVSSILPIVIDKLAHSREFVRQKAVAALILLTFRSCSDNKSSDIEISDNCHPSDSYQRDVFLRAFGDRDPSVMAASLPAFLHLAKRDPDWCRPLIPALVGVLRQVIEGRLHGDFSFHGVPSPWLQISLLRLFSLLGKGDHGASHQIYEVLGECMERARSKQMAAWAVLSECIRTLSVLPPHLELWTRASDFVGEMLQSSNANLQYMGVRCLADMARVEPGTVLCHRPSVLCALEQPDPAIRRRTLELLCRVVGQENVEAVCGHLLSALRDTRDPYEARSLASRTLDLAYSLECGTFSPNSEWLVGIVTEVLSMKEEIIPPDEPGRFLWLLVKEDEESAESLKFHALQALMASSTAISSRTSQPLLQAITWVLGEISHVQADISSADISSRLSRILVPPVSRQASHPHASSGIPIEMQAWLLTGLSKILSRQANELKNASLITEQIREESRDEEGQDVEMTRETGGEGGFFERKDTDHLLEKAEIFSKVDDQVKDMNATQKNQTSSSPEVIEEKANGSQAVLDSEECNEIGMVERVDIMGTSDVDQNKVSLDKFETEAGKSEISMEDNGTRQRQLPLPALDLLSEDPCIQQLIDELRRLWASPSLFATVLPASPGCRTPLVDPSLPFLDGFVAEALRKGAAPYLPPQLRQLDKQGSSYDVREVHVSGALSESVGQRISPTSTAGNSWAQEAGSDVSADITQPATRVWGPEGRTHCPSPTRPTATTSLPTPPGGSESGSRPPSLLGAVSHEENREREKDEEIQAGRKKLAASLFAGVGNIQGHGSSSRTNRELSLASESIKDVSSHTALALSTEEFGKLWTSAIHETRFAVSPPDPLGSLNQFSTAPGKAWLPDFAMQALRAVGFCNVATAGEEFLFAAQDIKTGAPLLLHCIVPLTGDIRLCARAKAPHLVQHLALSVQRALSSPPWPALNQKS